MARYDYAQAACPLIEQLAETCKQEFPINPELYTKYDVKRGLRDLNGKGVLAGLTNIGNVVASKTVDGVSVPCDGKLYYRGIDVEDLVTGFIAVRMYVPFSRFRLSFAQPDALVVRL